MANAQGSPATDGEGTGIFGSLLQRYTDELFLFFRVLFAFFVGLHGWQKAFGLWGFPVPHPTDKLITAAGWVEFFCAFLIGLGILTRLGAGALAVMMIVAYFHMHFALDAWPHLFPNPPGDMGGAFGAHGGEVPLLWFLIAGAIGVLGSRKWGLERLIFKKELL